MTTATRLRTTLTAAVGAACLVWATADAASALTRVTNRAALGGNDAIDWSQLGSASTAVANPFTATSAGGVTATGTIPTGILARVDQGNGWNGSFAPGDAVLWTNANPGPLSLVFSTPVFGAGAQIEANYFGAFTARIEAFNASGTSLGYFDVDGTSAPAGDNSAIFVGVLDSTADIKKLVFNVTKTANSAITDFAINKLSLQTTAAPVPTPALLPGLVGLGLSVWRQRKEKTAA
jgi:hypothetical protein